MHFDVIVESSTPYDKAIEYGKEYLKRVGQNGQKMTQEECQFCHNQQAPREVEQSIKQKGYFIQQMKDVPMCAQQQIPILLLKEGYHRNMF